MRRLMGLMFFAAVLAAGARLGAAVDTTTAAPGEAAQPVAAQRVALPSAGIRDEAAMVLIGTMLIGLAAAVRRAA